ncbi:prepilin peptidase [Thermophilibacter provencensis]|uniref:prepilin peptidase n=1 Tax=Thermophilibacter provencensis TaxID=1852386 RepID=UPI00094ADCA7|nr:A24 family peptidase [Thermophilibacter provencensis]
MDLVVVATWVVARAALAVALGLAAIEDLARRVIPDGCSVAVAASGAVAAAARAAAGEEAGALVADALAGALATLGVMLGAALASWRARGTPGVGGGDVKLLGAVGVWLGPAWGLAAVALSCGGGSYIHLTPPAKREGGVVGGGPVI